MNSLMPSKERSLRLKTVCLFKRLIVGQFIRKSCFLDRMFGMLASEKVVSFFMCEECKFLSFGFRSELATEVDLHGTIRLDSKIRSQNVRFHDSF